MSELRAWVEVDLARLRRNFALINAEKPAALRVVSVLKDNAYGHGAIECARVAVESGARFIAVVTLDEALDLRRAGIAAPILLLGQRSKCELGETLAHNLTVCIHDVEIARELSLQAEKRGLRARVHLEVDTGMSRYGVRWSEASKLAAKIADDVGLELEGVMSHFSMSDEPDKTFANLQLARFQEVLDGMAGRGIVPALRHLCNSGGFLDLPAAHFDMARLGILPLGIFPSRACRRIEGILPVMSVKSRIVHVQHLEAGDKVGYGMSYTATTSRRIGVLPIGYGDGFPRVRNEGAVLVHGKRAPLVGGVSMDAITVDLTDIPEARIWDECVVMGSQGRETIDANEVAALKKSVSYDVLTNWRGRLKRIHLSAR